jgi:hypothetical protein
LFELAVVTKQDASDKLVEGTFQAELAGLTLRVEQAESLAAGETKSVKLVPRDFTQLAVKNAKLWWPAQMGSPNLYDLHTSFSIANAISDLQHTPVGIREITSEMTDKGARLLRVNGKPILIRGGGWAPDMMLRRNPQRLRAEFQYVQDMNLNTIRLEGKSKVTNSSNSPMKKEFSSWRVGAVAIFGKSGTSGRGISWRLGRLRYGARVYAFVPTQAC